MKSSESIKTIAPALLAAQKSIGKVLKSADNPYFKSKYADLGAVIDAVKEPLNEHGITFLQYVDIEEDKTDVLRTQLLHESGEWVMTSTKIHCKAQNDPQAYGSAITYSKRYALQALVGLPTEDDDGNSANNLPQEPPQKGARQNTRPAAAKPSQAKQTPASAPAKPSPKCSVDQVAEIQALLIELDADGSQEIERKMTEFFKVNAIHELSEDQADAAIANLNKKKGK